MKLFLWIFLMFGVGQIFSIESRAEETATSSKAEKNLSDKTKKAITPTFDAFKSGDVNGNNDFGAAMTSPTGEKLDEEIKTCKDGDCTKNALSASRLTDGNCYLGSNEFDSDCVKSGALDVKFESQDQNQ